MSRIFTTTACLLTLCGPAAFAQTSMTNTSPSMSAPNDGRPSQMAPKPKTPSRDSQNMGPAMASPNTTAGKQETTPPVPNTSSNTSQ
jgi:hypothetical protein